eukprot:4878781-Prorocentrum_lima.AAC.1
MLDDKYKRTLAAIEGQKQGIATRSQELQALQLQLADDHKQVEVEALAKQLEEQRSKVVIPQ